jgi:hypothetical protein
LAAVLVGSAHSVPAGLLRDFDYVAVLFCLTRFGVRSVYRFARYRAIRRGYHLLGGSFGRVRLGLGGCTIRDEGLVTY